MTTQDLQQHYQALWLQSLSRFEQHQFETDPLLTAKNDSRYGVTLLARPSEQVKQHIQHSLAELMLLEPAQYYYPATDLHLTVLSLISCYSGFDLSQIDTAAYVELVQQVIKNTGPFRLHFHGITASPSCVLVQGFFEDQQLNQLRAKLRSAFGQSTLQHSIDQRYAIQTAHMTVSRFSQQPANPELFLQKIKALASVNFGTCLIDELELVGNDWYQRQQNTVLLGKFSL
ncbi:2'-5' RNA ligase family protein [Rheinheimera sp. 1928-s]|uniref:2'-5' RNA ligase family protein n=1 Tax=Rheinheimera sp. 1928-s TaxID=3033803 RepID=UPI002604631C|nr:2'-5' RNA ligase family protein [Rheinheimera sp. 1928-s]MDF3126716.1 2'-5' RNA ligase family protein [Rheinheimera sp. 1928-s]